MQHNRGLQHTPFNLNMSLHSNLIVSLDSLILSVGHFREFQARLVYGCFESKSNASSRTSVLKEQPRFGPSASTYGFGNTLSVPWTESAFVK